MSTFIVTLSALLAASPEEELRTQVPAARSILDAWHADEPSPGDRKFIIAYFTPADCDPAPQYRERLSRVLFDVQKFYLDEMRRNGFGDRTLRFETENDGLIRIHLVKGAKPKAHYKTESGREIRTECYPVLREAGVSPNTETLAIFCNLSDWDENAKTISQHSPYYAGGTHKSGTAWQCDSPILDSALIDRKEPIVQDGQYGRISLGKYNTTFVGGVAHEFGHALQLPHDAERQDQRALFGTSLMGSGNHTYGSERRGEAARSFLTLATALRVASHPMFSGSVKGFDSRAKAEAKNVEVVSRDRGFDIAATITADPPIYGAVAYMNPVGNSDYDSATATAVPDDQGRIHLECQSFRAGRPGAFKVVLLHCNGAISTPDELSFPYDVDGEGVVDLWAAKSKATLSALEKAIKSKKPDDAHAALERLRKEGASARLLEAAEVVVSTLKPAERVEPAAAEGPMLRLTDASSRQAKTGWGAPSVNRLPDESPLFTLGGRLYARGLYAHAPSVYEYAIDGKWDKLTAIAGLADGHSGTVVFVVTGDGKELFRSRTTRGETPVRIDVSVKGVRTLTLTVEDAGDGNGADWGVWLDPVLQREAVLRP
ncbi:NPCBM/NEW2 domain protein [Caulifigura coniformis]|uniref:NPCBM/NEW2 domain protein n=1 Tax=Caulifigura coniformis TaxID=2527983 RepID=A0A517SE04_9PLAN|nr:NPCBM/NEW2 domain-containing protein [Caulifigura coniformis]QDT54355.1 NPCBM/NEW2 domain protein [Caulifigura coniformis]